MSNPVTAVKQALREQLSQKRSVYAAMPEAESQGRIACARVTRVLQSRYGDTLAQVVLAAYMPMRGEIDPMPAMEGHPGPVCLPVITGRGQPLEFHRWECGATLVEGLFRVRIPQMQDPLRPGALIVPLLGFDKRGFRLGYGGGYYDRTLSGLRSLSHVFAIGLAYDIQEAPDLPTDAFDQRLDLIITPSRVFYPEQASQ